MTPTISAVVLKTSTYRRNRPEQDQGQGVPHQPYRALQRPHADGHAVGCRWASICQVPHRGGGVLAAMECQGVCRACRRPLLRPRHRQNRNRSRDERGSCHRRPDLFRRRHRPADFNRPQAQRADLQMYEQMAVICESVNADRSIRGHVLTGAGDKAFARAPTFRSSIARPRRIARL